MTCRTALPESPVHRDTTVRIHCAFCIQLESIYLLPRDERDAAVDALFDRADRARLLRQAYGRRKGRTR